MNAASATDAPRGATVATEFVDGEHAEPLVKRLKKAVGAATTSTGETT